MFKKESNAYTVTQRIVTANYQLAQVIAS